MELISRLSQLNFLLFFNLNFRFSGGDEEEDKEVGWKYIHGDVFRYPPQMSLFCAVLGTGTQLLLQ